MKQSAFSSNPFTVFKWQKAKKEYHCRNCNKLILQGDTHCVTSPIGITEQPKCG